MKLRIKGNSIRLRLSKSEVAKLVDTGNISEQTSFGNNKLEYALQKADKASQLSAAYEGNKITVFIPASFIQGWPWNDTVGFDARIPLPGTDSLFILVEKDFICIDETTEDQSDNYENPNKAC